MLGSDRNNNSGCQIRAQTYEHAIFVGNEQHTADIEIETSAEIQEHNRRPEQAAAKAAGALQISREIPSRRNIQQTLLKINKQKSPSWPIRMRFNTKSFFTRRF